MAPRTWKVGEIAGRTGVSVRTLHHYEAIGLLGPVARNEGGHRCYTEAQVERLQRIISLRALGLPLAELAGLLDTPEGALLPVVERHLARLAAEIAMKREAHDRLARLRVHLARGEGIPVTQLLETMEAITMIEKYLTPAQIQTLQANQETGARAVAAFKENLAALRAFKAEGRPPSDPEVQAVARRQVAARELAAAGDEGLAEGLKRMVANEQEMRDHIGLDDDIREYMGEAIRSLR